MCPIPLGLKIKVLFHNVLAVCAFFLLDSCRLDTDALTTIDTLERSLPNIVISDVVYKEKENSKLVQEVYADEFRVFTNDNLVQVDEGQVKTYRDGVAQLEGSAATAEYNQRSEDANVLGPIEVYYYPEETRIWAQKLDWINQERKLLSEPDSVVEIEQNNGTKFQGRNFSVDMRTMTVSYEKMVEGKLYAEAQTQANQNQAEPPPQVPTGATGADAQAQESKEASP